jgi:eukaryotic-like serine/threonine-protein kinase
MSLTAGAKLGPYEIVAPLGAGGMGEVYRARDTRLGRDVAIKVLNDEAFGMADRRARFEREARAAAALNHPNIVALYDTGADGGRFYIVTELVEGESLRGRIQRGQIPVRELYRIAVQFADGMAAAHAAGITHRDLKPENIMLTTEGRVKILDFGLARQAAKAAAVSDSTVTELDTQPGTVLGTVVYMSPEQVRGLAVDHRSDQFSFGVVLYEMATGKRPFASETHVQTMSAILTEEPKPIDAKIPAPLRWTIGRCLEKDVTARYDSSRDLYRELSGQQKHLSDVLTAAEAVPSPAGGAPAAVPARRKWLLRAVIAAAIVLAAAGGAWWERGHSVAGAGHYRFTPMEVSWANPVAAIWSPDGKAFAYVAEVAGVNQVFLRYLNSPTPVQLTHGGSATESIGWSPDSKRVIFVGDNPQGKKPPRALFSVPVFGGEPKLVMPLDGLYATISPDGKVLGVITYQDDFRLVVKTASPLGSPLQPYAPAPFKTKDFVNRPNLKFSPDGRRSLLFIDFSKGRQAWSLPWPPGGAAPQQVLRGMPDYGGTPQFSWLPDSRHIILSLQEKHDDEHSHLWIADVDSGERRQITSDTSKELSPAVSPDGKKLLVGHFRADYAFVSVSLENAAADRVFSSELAAGMPAWAMRQEKFAYVTDRNGPAEIWMRGEGWDRPIVTPATFLAGTTNWFMTPALSPGAERLVYTRIDASGHAFNWISSVSGGPPVRLTNESNVAEYGGSWSPDGNSLTYARQLNGERSVMTVSTSGEATPVLLRAKVAIRLSQWSPDGQWIKFLDHAGGGGWTLISPDGKTVRALGIADAIEMTFSKDSRSLYGIRREQDRARLFSLDIETKAMKNIGDLAKDFLPSSYLVPGIRLSLSPDGKSILYPAVRTSGSLWMLEGFE